MAISLSYFPIISVLLLLLSTVSEAAVVTYNWNITWVQANPDGQFSRPTIGINGKWPLPVLSATVNDTVIVNVNNQLGNQTTTLHFHGLYQNGTNYMDGPLAVTQCGIAPGSSFTYNFTINQPGTYWYHSHAMGQYPDGLRGPLIVTDPDMPYMDEVDEEVVLTLSDWYHDQMADLIPAFINRINPTGAEPVPNSSLMNDTQNITFAMTAGTTYMFRVINMGAFAGQYLWFEGHNMTIVEVDGIYTQQAEAEMIYLTAAQRCSFLITAKNDTTANYAFVAAMDTTLFDVIPDGLNTNTTGWLVYNSTATNPDPQLIEDDEYDPFDDFTLVPYDNMTLYTDPVTSIELTVVMDNLGDGANYAFFNNITYVAPKVPSLYTVLNSGASASDARIYGEYTHSFVLGYQEVIEIVVNNADPGRHPFHLHGHNFQVVARSDEDAGDYVPGNETFPDIPMRRDTVMAYGGGHVVVRFVSDNRVWLFHCHLEWHMDSGLIATMVEAPTEMQKTLIIPANHLANCAVDGTPTSGNAAGNTVNLLDLTGQNTPPAPLPAGFTARGIVALVFSVIAALLGLTAITFYGLADMGSYEMEREKRRLAEAHIPAPAAPMTMSH